MGRYEAHLLSLQRTIVEMEAREISDPEARSILFELFCREILPLRYFRQVADTYFHPTPEMTDVRPRTL